MNSFIITLEKEKKILELLYSKAPNSLTYDLIISSSEYTEEETEKILNSLVKKGILVTDFHQTNRPKIIKPITDRRKSYYIKDFPETYPIKEHIKVGTRMLPRLLDGDKARAEDVNGIIEAIVDYSNEINDRIDQRVKRETEQIYRQMIGIFGVFVSIFAIIVISTDKMLRFNPDILNNEPWSLFLKSAALFLPVGIVIGGLVFVVMRATKR